MSNTVKDALKGAKVIVYARVSSGSQKKTLDNQVETVLDYLDAAGFKKEPLAIFAERKSGQGVSKKARPKLHEAMDLARKTKGKVVIAVKDIGRFSRSPWGAGFLIHPLVEDKIPIIDLTYNKVTGAAIEDDLILPILASVAGQEPKAREKASKPQIQKAREAGIVNSTLDLYPDEEHHPIREYIALAKRGHARTAIAVLMGRSADWARKTEARIASADKGGKLQEWLKVTDMVRDMEIMHGPRFQRGKRGKVKKGKKPRMEMIAVGRKTSGYLESPNDYDAPTKEDIDYYFQEYLRFQPKR